MGESWDVFVCHATEDKGIVRPLAEALQQRGLRVWYDEFTLRLGDSLREALDRGLRNSSFGLVVLSPAFFSKQWTQWELNAFVTRQLSGRRRIIIPVWHEITADEVKAQSPSLADLIAANTASGLQTVVEQIIDAVGRVALTESSTVHASPESPTRQWRWRPVPRPQRPEKPPSPPASQPRPNVPTPEAAPIAPRPQGPEMPPSPPASQSRPNVPTPDRVRPRATVNGVVKWWSDNKGFGFLTPDDGGRDVFAHHSGVIMDGYRTLSEGARVKFERVPGEKGPKAVNIRTV